MNTLACEASVNQRPTIQVSVDVLAILKGRLDALRAKEAETKPDNPNDRDQVARWMFYSGCAFEAERALHDLELQIIEEESAG